MLRKPDISASPRRFAPHLTHRSVWAEVTSGCLPACNRSFIMRSPSGSNSAVECDLANSLVFNTFNNLTG